MSRVDEDAKKFARMLLYLVDCINYYQTMSSCNNCNDCGKKLKCEYEPKAGEITRINCPLWESAVDDWVEKEFNRMVNTVNVRPTNQSSNTVGIWPTNQLINRKYTTTT